MRYISDCYAEVTFSLFHKKKCKSAKYRAAFSYMINYFMIYEMPYEKGQPTVNSHASQNGHEKVARMAGRLTFASAFEKLSESMHNAAHKAHIYDRTLPEKRFLLCIVELILPQTYNPIRRIIFICPIDRRFIAYKSL